MPMEILCLQIQGKDIGKYPVKPSRDISGGLIIEVGGCSERRSAARLKIVAMLDASLAHWNSLVWVVLL
jgi:hypothetical protein